MSQIQKAFFGAVAITFALGAAQLASGHDLADRWQAVAAKADQPGQKINRSGKSDRLAETRTGVPSRTVSMQLNDLANTSILLRVPASIETGSAKAPSMLKDQQQGRTKPTLACEPMVSALTEVAKLLQPGRCVT
jgi:hypothetical protein